MGRVFFAIAVACAAFGCGDVVTVGRDSSGSGAGSSASSGTTSASTGGGSGWIVSPESVIPAPGQHADLSDAIVDGDHVVVVYRTDDRVEVAMLDFDGVPLGPPATPLPSMPNMPPSDAIALHAGALALLHCDEMAGCSFHPLDASGNASGPAVALTVFDALGFRSTQSGYMTTARFTMNGDVGVVDFDPNGAETKGAKLFDASANVYGPWLSQGFDDDSLMMAWRDPPESSVWYLRHISAQGATLGPDLDYGAVVTAAIVRHGAGALIIGWDSMSISLYPLTQGGNASGPKVVLPVPPNGLAELAAAELTDGRTLLFWDTGLGLGALALSKDLVPTAPVDIPSGNYDAFRPIVLATPKGALVLYDKDDGSSIATVAAIALTPP